MRTIYICVNCLEIEAVKIGNLIVCRNCHHKENLRTYKEILSDAKFATRIGYQYRLKFERSFGFAYLAELHKIFDFLGLAVVSGIAGNLAYDQIKAIIKRIIHNPLIIKIRDKQFQKLLNDDKEIEIFIRYIEEYRNKKVNSKDGVLDAMLEEERAHKATAKFLSSPEGKEFAKVFNKWAKKNFPKKRKKRK